MERVSQEITLMLHNSQGKSAEKTLHDDFILTCIHLTESSQSVHLPVDARDSGMHVRDFLTGLKTPSGETAGNLNARYIFLFIFAC
jgi:hypothetical protein